MITKSTLDFLKELKKNNNREWFEKNKPTFKKCMADFVAEVDLIITSLAKFDKTLRGLKAKDCVFRIYRDVRFSNNKNPYKHSFGASISKGGRKSSFPGYYFHLEPGNSFLVGGSYTPEPKDLAKIRQEIDYNAKPLKKIMAEKEFKNIFGKLEGEKLKTSPRDYANDHPEIELLRHKSFLLMHKLTDKQLKSDTFREFVIQVFKAMLPLNTYLRVAIG